MENEDPTGRLKSHSSNLLREGLAEVAAGIFGDESNHKKQDDAVLISQLYQQFGKLKVERDVLGNVLGR